MSQAKICKICGCEYPYCKTVTKNKFRYQDVACCPEHGAEYFRRISISRGLIEDTPPLSDSLNPVKDSAVDVLEDDLYYIDDEVEEDLEEEFEDYDDYLDYEEDEENN